jgi:hypothetical protein
MEPEQFVARWKREVYDLEPEFIRDDLRLLTCPADSPLLATLPTASARFLVAAGLPSSCAPFLGFSEIGRGLKTLVEVWRLDGVVGIDTEELRRYIVLGSDGAGNPLCLDSKDHGKIFMVDHDDAFRSRSLMASSVPQLAEALLLIHTLPHEDFGRNFMLIDPNAAGVDGFLPKEVEMLKDA